jgi:hypothetical protein
MQPHLKDSQMGSEMGMQIQQWTRCAMGLGVDSGRQGGRGVTNRSGSGKKAKQERRVGRARRRAVAMTSSAGGG